MFAREAWRLLQPNLELVLRDPGNVDAWNGRGALLRSLGRIDEALESFNRAIALAPDQTGYYANRAHALMFEAAFASPDCPGRLLPAAR